MTMFFSSWESLLRVVVIGVGAYIALVVILRLSGNRTLSKMNSFDFVITIALGSTFATAILQQSVALADAVLAFAILAGMQFITTFFAVRYPQFENVLNSEPVLLFRNGQYLYQSMRAAHVTKEEVLAGMRQMGYSSPDDVEMVVLETNGKITAMGK